MQKTFDGTPLATIRNTETGIPFTMRLVRKGDGYGRDLARVHDEDRPLVEFYDARFQFADEKGAEFGQFVSRYYLGTLRAHGPRALFLDGGVPAWTIDAAGMGLAFAILDNWTA